MFYWIKTHWIVKRLLSKFIWHIPNKSRKIFLTFDDGPTPDVTTWVLSALKKYNAKATFFCIGENVEKYPAIFQEISDAGHAIGNHTFNHLNGWKTATDTYVDNFVSCEVAIDKMRVGEAQNSHSQNSMNSSANVTVENIEIKNQKSKISKLFRPPYGKMKYSQSTAIRKLGYQIVMWDVLSADFDTAVSKEKCLENVLRNIRSGSIVIFHDSQKAYPNLKYVLPRVLEFFKEKKYVCEIIG